MFALLLNKEEFVCELVKMGVARKVIEAEWNEIEHLFSVFYIEEAYKSFDEDTKSKIIFGLDQKQESEGLIELIKRVTKILTEQPNLIDQVRVIKTASQKAQKSYSTSRQKEQTYGTK